MYFFGHSSGAGLPPCSALQTSRHVLPPGRIGSPFQKSIIIRRHAAFLSTPGFSQYVLNTPKIGVDGFLARHTLPSAIAAAPLPARRFSASSHL